MLRSIALAALISLIACIANAQDPDLTILNVDTNGVLVDGGGSLLDISSNGRHALIWSDDPLLPEDTVGQQVYVHDLDTNTLELISVDTNGNPVADGSQDASFNSVVNRRAISDDGRYALFGTTSTNVVPGVSPPVSSVYVYQRDRVNQTTTLISVNNDDVPADRGIIGWTMDPTGVAVLFQTDATNLDPIAPP